MQENINIPDSNITTNLTFRQLVLMNMQQLTNFPYIEKDFDALTDYELLCLVVKFLNDVIANQNEQNASITRMYESFLALQDYVNNTKDEVETAFNNLDNYVRNYFDNLDVQEEINNKLDDMLEQGTLQEIIEQFIQTNALWTFDTVADMKLANNLINGSYARTLGYHSKNDGGEAVYKIRTRINDDVVDEGSIIELADDTLIAELIYDKIKPEYFGAYGDLTHDDTEAIQKAVTFANTTEKYEVILTKKYLTTQPITLYSKIILRGISSELNDYNLLSTLKNETSDIFYLTLVPSETNPNINNIKGLNILNITILGNDNNKLFSNLNDNSNRTRLNWGIIENCYFRKLASVFNYCYFTGFQVRNMNIHAKTIGNFGMTDCHFYNWFVNSTIFNLDPTSSQPMITIDTGYVSTVSKFYLTGDTSNVDYGPPNAILMKNCRNFHLSDIVFDYFPGNALYLQQSNTYPNTNCIIDNIVVRGCSTSSIPSFKQAIILNGKNIKMEKVSFYSPHLSGFEPNYAAINVYNEYGDNIVIKDIYKSSEWQYDFSAMDRCSILENINANYIKMTNKSSIKRIYSGWTAQEPITLASNQELTFTRPKLEKLLTIDYVGYQLPSGVELIALSNGDTLSFTIKNNSESSIILNEQTTFYVCYTQF